MEHGLILPPYSQPRNFTVGIKTFFKFYSVNLKTGRETPLTGWCPNTILNSGRNRMGVGSWFTHCQVGTNSTPGNASQTALLGYVAGTNTLIETVFNAQASAPYYGWKRKRFRFDVGSGIANENLSEVAIGWSADSGDTIAARALIVDVDGIQTTITPLPDEVLDIVAEVRYYPPANDATGTIVIDGVTYNYTLRAAAVTSGAAWGENIGSVMQAYSTSGTHWAAYDDDIGDVTQYPNGTTYDCDNSNEYNDTYSNNSYTRRVGITGGPTGWNATTNKLLRSLRMFTTGGHYQIQFDSQANPGFGIPKVSPQLLQTRYNLSWQEQVIP